MKRAYAIDVLLNLLVLSWLSLSLHALARGDSELFQRLGSWGVAVSIFYFLGVKPHAVVHESVVQRLGQLGRHQRLNSQHIEGAYRNAALTAHDVNKTREELGLASSEFGKSMSEALKSELAKEPLDYDEYNSKFQNIIEAEIEAGQRLGKISVFRERFQNSMAVLSTLQWGFGDQLSNAIKCGAVSC